jgi:NADPH:quinone reductase-like Zn-dependent oxidoreductase
VKAVTIGKYGNVDVLELRDMAVPAIGPREVLVKLRTAALNHLDIWVRVGAIPGLDLSQPHILGSDGAGEVAEVGAEVKKWKKGDLVVINPGISCGRCDHCLRGEQSVCNSFHVLGEHLPGTFAEFVKVPEENLLPKPPDITWQQAAAFPLVFLTAWRMLISRARLKPGETLLIPGIGGGVATAALTIAKTIGCTVVVTSSSQEKLGKAKSMGADLGIDYTREDVAAVVYSWTGKRGVDVVCDSVAGDTLDKHIQCLAKGGRLVTCGVTAGAKPQIDFRRVFWNQITILGSTMGSHQDFFEIHRLVAKKTVLPTIDSVYPLAEVKAAQKRMEEKQQFGKIVVEI